MSTTYPLTAALALANLRIDLADTNAALYRWQDSDLNRAIDKSVEQYSWANPRLQAVQIPAVAQQIIYPYPAGAYYIDAVEYPLGQWPKAFITSMQRRSPLIPAPSTAPAATLGPGGALSAGAYNYACTFTVPGGGETTLSPLSASVTAAGGQSATLTGIPIGPYGVSGRNLYRTAANGVSHALLAALADNTTGAYVDTAADSALGVSTPASNSTNDLDQLELQLPPELYPLDNSTTLEITYAAKHELDTNGTTIPERHWDVLYLGAMFHAMRSYLPQVNDNFEYNDGHLRDRIDDTKSAIAWQTSCDAVRADHQAALARIKAEANAAIGTGASGIGLTHWGDKPLRYERL